MEHDVFLSYSRRDADKMKQIRDMLRSSGITVWTDEGIETGTRSWKRSIEKAILDARYLVCLLSPDANQSEWVRAEIEFAELHDKHIFLVLVRGDKRDSIPFGFATMQWVDVRDEDSLEAKVEQFAQVLVEKVKSSLKTETLSQSSDPKTDLNELKRLGNTAYYAERYDEAIQHYTGGLALDDSDLTLHLNRGISYLERQQYDLAIVDLRHALQLVSDDDYEKQIGFYRLGQALSAVGRMSEAVEAYSSSIEIEPIAATHFKRGNCRFEIGDYDGAVEDYTQAIRLDRESNYPSAYNNRGECRFILGHFQPALADFRHAKEVMVDKLYADAGQAVTLFAIGKNDDAVLIWDALVQIDSDLDEPEYVQQRFGWAESMVNHACSLIAERQQRK